MSDNRDLQAVEERLGVVERRSHHLLLAGIAVAGMATAVWLVWRSRRRAAALPAARLRAVPGSGRPSSGTAGARKPHPRRKKTS
jgi:hypothetical protein